MESPTQDQSKNKAMHVCSTCSRSFKKKKELIMHYCPNRPIFNCPRCKKSFFDEASLNKHVIVHGHEKVFTCDKCSKEFPRKKLLNDHFCSIKQYFHCNLCPLKFCLEKTLIKHKKIHKEEPKYDCRTCNKKFFFAYELKKHKNEHAKPHQCEVCLKTFSTKWYFKAHESLCLGILPFQCSHCPESYALKDDLKKHKWNVHSIQKKYKCKICTIEFVSKSKLNEHVLLHSSAERFAVKPKFWCHKCSVVFHKRAELINHVGTHLEELPFNCNFCDQTFKSKYLSDKHVKEMHKVEAPVEDSDDSLQEINITLNHSIFGIDVD